MNFFKKLIESPYEHMKRKRDESLPVIRDLSASLKREEQLWAIINKHDKSSTQGVQKYRAEIEMKTVKATQSQLYDKLSENFHKMSDDYHKVKDKDKGKAQRLLEGLQKNIQDQRLDMERIVVKPTSHTRRR